MELDHLKAMWSNENVAETPEISTEKQKEIHLPLERIRKNMRTEFYWTAVLFVLIILFFAVVDMHFFKFKVYIITLVVTMMLITSFYFFKFFQLYKNISVINLNTWDALKDLKFQFKLNEQYYLAFYIAFAPFVVCEMLLVFEYTPPLQEITGLRFILTFLATCIGTLGALYVFGKFWFNRYYGKYFNQIYKIIDDLR